jgi:hypothetical protein
MILVVRLVSSPTPSPRQGNNFNFLPRDITTILNEVTWQIIEGISKYLISILQTDQEKEERLATWHKDYGMSEIQTKIGH